MGKVLFLSLEQILVIHETQIDKYGGSDGLRDISLLESATYRPQTTFDGQDLYSSVFDKAAALGHSLILNHPFIDGNKRTGMFCVVVFLELNGFPLELTQEEFVELAILIAAGKLEIADISQRLKKISKKQEDKP